MRNCRVCGSFGNNNSLPFGLCIKCLHKIGVWNKNKGYKRCNNRSKKPKEWIYMQVKKYYEKHFDALSDETKQYLKTKVWNPKQNMKPQM